MLTKILFLLRDFERGGIPRVMLNLIEHIEKNEYQVDIFCGNPVGIFANGVPDNCKLMPYNVFLRAIMCNLNKEKGLFKLFAFAVKSTRRILLKLLHIDIINLINNSLRENISKKKYDVLWACSEGLPAQWCKEIKAKKIIWIHNDYSWDCARGDRIEYTDFSQFDKIICVSEFTKKSFCNIYPEYVNKTDVLYNLLNEKEIIEKSKQTDGIPFDSKVFNIVSIGRFSFQKNFEIIPKIAAEIYAEGITAFRWYIIGNGGPKETMLIKNAVKEYNVDEFVIFLGEQENPYKFLNKADLFVLTSRYESYPTVINEAKILGVPVISTDFNGVEEILSDKHGRILSIGNFSNEIAAIIKDPNKLQAMKKEQFCTDTTTIMEKFYAIIQEDL